MDERRDSQSSQFDPYATSSSLISQLKQQRSEGWERFSATYGPIVYGWCRGAELQPADAADVMQNVFWSVAKGIVRFNKTTEKAGFRRWLKTVTSRRIIDFQRQNERTPRGVGGSSGDGGPKVEPPVETVAPWTGRVSREQLDRAMEVVKRNVNATTWSAFVMLFFEDCPANEVARVLRISTVSARMKKYRVLRRLREVIVSEEA